MQSAKFENLSEGIELQGGSRTIGETEISMLPALMGAANPLFTDARAARERGHRDRILFGPGLLGIALGLTEQLFRDNVIALVEITKLRFLKSVSIGDQITATATVLWTRETKDPHRGLICVKDTVSNGEGETVMEFERVIMLRRGKDGGDGSDL